MAGANEIKKQIARENSEQRLYQEIIPADLEILVGAFAEVRERGLTRAALEISKGVQAPPGASDLAVFFHDRKHQRRSLHGQSTAGAASSRCSLAQEEEHHQIHRVSCDEADQRAAIPLLPLPNPSSINTSLKKKNANLDAITFACALTLSLAGDTKAAERAACERLLRTTMAPAKKK